METVGRKKKKRKRKIERDQRKRSAIDAYLENRNESEIVIARFSPSISSICKTRRFIPVVYRCDSYDRPFVRGLMQITFESKYVVERAWSSIEPRFRASRFLLSHDARRNVNFTATPITRSRVVPKTRGDKSAGVKARSEASERSRYRIERERSVIRRIESYLWPRAASSVDAWVGSYKLETGGRTRVFEVSGARAEVGEEMDGKERAEKGAGVERRGSRGATRKGKKKRKTVCLVAWPADGTS